MMKKLSILPVIFLFLLFACDTTDQNEIVVQEIVTQVKENYARDGRVAVFNIGWELQRNQLILRGEVDNPDAKDALVTNITEHNLPEVVDSITVLPHPDLGEKQHAVVTVSVGNMRSNHRYTADLVTQVIMGMQVRVLKQRGNWYYIQAPNDYLGWIHSGALELMTGSELRKWENTPKIIVTELYGIVRENPHTNALPISNAVIGSIMSVRGTSGGWYEVTLPNSHYGYIEQSISEDYSIWKENTQLTGESIEATAKQFLGIPYLWGGTSVKGFDCSGFTKIVFLLNGMELQRDASQQVHMGEHVDPGENFSDLNKGDLVFFGQEETDEQPERIVHVGIYLDDGEFVHGTSTVRIDSFFPDADNFNEYELNRFVRARRLIQ